MAGDHLESGDAGSALGAIRSHDRRCLKSRKDITMSSEDLKREFLYNAIADTVSTIRAVDTKLHIVLGLYLIPLVITDGLFKAMSNWSKAQDWNDLCFLQVAVSILAAASLLLWITGVIISLRGIIAISDPADVIEGEKPEGTFYHVGSLVKAGLFHFKIDSKLADYMSKLPKSDSEVVKELAFEQMKLAYIREVKITRHKMAAYLAVLWGILTILTMIFCRMS